MHKLFGKICVPRAVYDELTGNINYQNEALIIQNCDFIKEVTINNYQSVSILKRATGLDLGESEAIVFSDEIKADLLLIDELKGRLVAKSMGLPIMGTLGILTLAYKEKLIDKQNIIKCIDIMKTAGRHISEKLYNQLLIKIESDI